MSGWQGPGRNSEGYPSAGFYAAVCLALLIFIVVIVALAA
jgi:hypothetical protein